MFKRLVNLFKKEQITTTDELVKWYRSNGGIATSSGASVTPDTAMQQETVLACVLLLADMIGMLPIVVKQQTESGIEDAPNHWAQRLVGSQPNTWMTPNDFWRWVVLHLELRGNAYAWKTFANGNVSELIPIHPDMVTVKQNRDYELTYVITDASGLVLGEYSADRIVHFRNTSANGITGLSRIGMGRERIGFAQQVERHGGSLFKHGTQLGKVVSHPSTLTDAAYDRLNESINNDYSGAENAFKTIILEENMKMESLGMTAEDSQFLETQKFNVERIAAIFRVPLHLIQHTENSTSWGTGLSELTRGFVKYSLMPRFAPITQALERDLLGRKDKSKYSFRFDTSELLRADAKEMMEAMTRAVETGIYNPNEARAELGKNPREGGDEYTPQLNMTPAGEDE